MKPVNAAAEVNGRLTGTVVEEDAWRRDRVLQEQRFPERVGKAA